MKARWCIAALLVLSACLVSATAVVAQSPAEEQAAVRGQQVTLPSGAVISVRLADAVDSRKNHFGDLISGTVDPSVIIGNQVVIPRGTEAHLLLVEDKKGGRILRHAEIQLELVSLIINGTKLEVQSSTYEKKKGVLASKAAPEAKASANAAGSLAMNGQPGVADPVIAAFRAAQVREPAGSRIDFRLTAPFTFQEPPVNVSQ